MTVDMMLLTALPWLPSPGPDEKERFAQLAAQGADTPLSVWRSMLAFSWPERNLRRAGERIVAHLANGSDPDRADATRNGLAHLRLLVLSSKTFTHMAEIIVASALRHGVVAELDVIEYTSPASWLNDPANHAHGYDAVLLATDSTGWQLSATATEETEQQVLDRVSEHIQNVTGRLIERGARSVIFETLVDDLSQMPINLDTLLAGSQKRLRQGFNLRLGEVAAATSQLVLDVDALAIATGSAAWWPGRYWYSAKFPLALACVPLYGDALGRILAAKVGKSRRVLVLDLDNTLWSGVIGDDGLEGIVIGQGSAAGEAHIAIQKIARAYAARGVILCVSSKNTHEVAIEPFRQHPDMLLREADIAVFRINWNDKASNLRAIAETLSLSLESFVFLDDNPVERKQVRDELPLVAVPELPDDVAEWPVLLASAGYFEQISFTNEDRMRGAFYKSLASRTALATTAGDTSEFLKSLNTKLQISPFDATGRNRIAQLISKSNQFNLTTKRYSVQDVERLEQDSTYVTLQIRLSDIFGDAGMISVVVGRLEGSALEIESWLMSCRVLSRRVEEAVLVALVDRAIRHGATCLTASYIPTARNGIVANHYERLGFAQMQTSQAGETRWQLAVDDYCRPDLPINVQDQG